MTLYLLFAGLGILIYSGAAVAGAAVSGFSGARVGDASIAGSPVLIVYLKSLSALVQVQGR